jgi:hypothetical protein
MLLIGHNKDIIKEVQFQLSSKFDMKDLGATKFLFAMGIKRDHVDRKLLSVELYDNNYVTFYHQSGLVNL